MMGLHLSKTDFGLDWFSGSGAGGQYRNKHRNCCRITLKACAHSRLPGTAGKPVCRIRASLGQDHRALRRARGPYAHTLPSRCRGDPGHSESRNEVIDRVS